MSCIKPVKNNACKKCPLYAQPSVWGQGNPASSIMLVGDYPREDDVRKGEVYSGFIGKQMNECFVDGGIPNDDVYKTYAVKCQLPEGAASTSKIVKEAREICKKLLFKEKSRIAPELMILTGDIPLQSVLNLKGISNLHGQLQELEDGTRVVPTVSPMALFRGNPKTQAILKNDIKKAGDLYNGATVKTFVPEYKVCKSMKSVMALADRLETKSIVAFDSETTAWDKKAKKPISKLGGLSYRDARFLTWQFSYRVSKDKYRTYIVPFEGYLSKNIWKKSDKEKIFARYKELFEKESLTWLIHNAMFDVRLLGKFLGIDPRKMKFEDTMLMQFTKNELEPCDLDSCADMYTDMGAYKASINQKYKDI